MKGICIFLADGFEETEALATLDVLRRGGLDVRTVSITDEIFVTGSHHIMVAADMSRSGFEKEIQSEDTGNQDVMIFPGGMPGTKNLASDEALMRLMCEHWTAGGTVAAICAAPGLVASQLPGLEGRKFTCFDGFEEKPVAKGAVYVKAPAVADGNLITGRGAGCAIDFGLAILAHVKGQEAAGSVRHAMMLG